MDESKKLQSHSMPPARQIYFLFDAKKKLYYRGQFDDSRPGSGESVGGDLLSANAGFSRWKCSSRSSKAVNWLQYQMESVKKRRKKASLYCESFKNMRILLIYNSRTPRLGRFLQYCQIWQVRTRTFRGNTRGAVPVFFFAAVFTVANRIILPYDV